jgi:hypothetical protein
LLMLQFKLRYWSSLCNLPRSLQRQQEGHPESQHQQQQDSRLKAQEWLTWQVEAQATSVLVLQQGPESKALAETFNEPKELRK